MLNKDMTLQERLCKDIESAWQGISYDKTLEISHETNAKCEYKNCTFYEVGPQHYIAFFADFHEEEGATDVRNAIQSIKEKLPACSKYNFTIREFGDGMSKQILLTLE